MSLLIDPSAVGNQTADDSHLPPLLGEAPLVVDALSRAASGVSLAPVGRFDWFDEQLPERQSALEYSVVLRCASAFRPPPHRSCAGAERRQHASWTLARLVLLPFVSDVTFLELQHILLIAQSKPSNVTLGQASLLLRDVCD